MMRLVFVGPVEVQPVAGPLDLAVGRDGTRFWYEPGVSLYWVMTVSLGPV